MEEEGKFFIRLLPSFSLFFPFSPSSSGAALIGVLAILLTISLIGATLASFFLSVTTVAEAERDRAQALYLGEAGIHQTIFELRQGGAGGIRDLSSQETPATRTLGDGEYEVTQDVVTGLITSTGSVHGVKRTIQIKYYAF